MGTKNLNSATDLITFTRASGGTALRKISYGNELVTNGTFDTDISGWTSYNSVISWDAGLLKVNDSANAGGGSQAYQVVTLEVGKRYRLTGSYENSTASRLWIDNSSSNVNPNSPTADFIQVFLPATTPSVDFAHTFVATATTTSIALEVDLVGTAYFDNISVKEVLFDQADGTLQLWNHNNNEPRIEYDATGAVKGLLIEEARTNLYPNSSDTSANSSFGITKTSDSAVSPDGTTTADLITPDTSYPRHLFQYSSSYSAGNGSTETYSFYAKSNGYNLIEVSQRNQGGGTVTKFDLSAVTATTTGGTEIFKSIEDVGNGWYRCSAAHITSSVRPYPAVEFLDTDGSQGFVPDGTSGIYFWGHQLEAGAFPSSYIPTSSSTATRAADVATIPTSAFGYNQKVGSVLFEGKVIKANIGTTIDRRIVEIIDGTTTNFISVYQDVSVDQNLRIANQDAGVLSVNADTGYTLSDAQTFKVAIGIKLNNFAVSVDGGAVVTDTTGTVSNTLSQIDIGKLGGGTQYLNGYIKSIKYYPRRLTNTQLQELTT